MGNCCSEALSTDASGNDTTVSAPQPQPQETQTRHTLTSDVHPHKGHHCHYYPYYSGYPCCGFSNTRWPVVGYPVDANSSYFQPVGPVPFMDPLWSRFEYNNQVRELVFSNVHHKHRHKGTHSWHSTDHLNVSNHSKDKRRGRKTKSHSEIDIQERALPQTEEMCAKSQKWKSLPHRFKRKKSRAKSASMTKTILADDRYKTLHLHQDLGGYSPCDVTIIYSHEDSDIMIKLKEQIQENDMTIWVPDIKELTHNDDVMNAFGEAIINAKLFVCLLNDQSAQSKNCREAVCLAYISNSAIFPVSAKRKEELLPLLDSCLKLQLSNCTWTSLTDPNTVDEKMHALVSSMKAEVDSVDREYEEAVVETLDKNVEAADGVEVVVDVHAGTSEEVGRTAAATSHSAMNLNRPAGHKPAWLRGRNRVKGTNEAGVHFSMPDEFWRSFFAVSDKVLWETFVTALLEECSINVGDTFVSNQRHQIMESLRRELNVDWEGYVYLNEFIGFCTVHGEVIPVCERMDELAREKAAIRNVFNVDSSFRLAAIKNLRKFCTLSVLKGLRDLLTDPDFNIRAVAAVSLAHTKGDDPMTINNILQLLNDKDSLVREAGCLALGYLKANQVVSKLAYVWRNDVTKNVREAAEVALHQIGGPEVEDTMRVTKKLAKELRILTNTAGKKSDLID